MRGRIKTRLTFLQARRERGGGKGNHESTMSICSVVAGGLKEAVGRRRGVWRRTLLFYSWLFPYWLADKVSKEV